MKNLNENILAKAFEILFGNEWKSNWSINNKANDMLSIINGGTQPCVPFENWLKCIKFLEEHPKEQISDKSIIEWKEYWNNRKVEQNQPLIKKYYRLSAKVDKYSTITQIFPNEPTEDQVLNFIQSNDIKILNIDVDIVWLNGKHKINL